jgi:hypothetical protein
MKEMHKRLLILILEGVVCCLPFYSETDTKAQFIKGNITDKISAVKQSSSNGTDDVAQMGLDFAIESNKSIPGDRDISALALASILALPSHNSVLTEKLITVFNAFNDETVRIAVLNRLVVNGVEADSLDLMNSFLRTAVDGNFNSNEVSRRILQALGSVGNSESYFLLYTCWQKKIWSEDKNIIESSLVQLGAHNIADCIKTISSASMSDTRSFFSLITTNQNISPEIKAEIAENVLSKTIHTTDDLSILDADTIALQLSAVKTIAENTWTRAAPLVIRYFELAKEEYSAHVIDADQFIGVIQGMVILASSDTASVLSDYLATLNQKAEHNDYTDKSVVLAVINALGTTGDKTSFDNLLYVTYLNYPEDVTSAAREALSKLKW